MNHDEFLAFVKSLLGKYPPMAARESLGNLIRSRGTSFKFLSEWVPKGMIGNNPSNPLLKIDGVRLEIGFCGDDSFTVYAP